MAAANLYEQLIVLGPNGVAIAKRHKLLHLRYRQFVPILDDQICRIYRSPAREMAKRSPHLCKPQIDIGIGTYERLFWLAIREGVVRNRDVLRTLRDTLRPRLVELTCQSKRYMSSPMYDFGYGRMAKHSQAVNEVPWSNVS